jgi:hypothetical protein
MDCIKSWFQVENARWEKILASPQRLDETLSKRLDVDRLIFSPLLNHLQMNALQSAQNSDSFRLLQFYQAIRNLEASVAARRQALAAQCNSFSLSRLIGHRQSRATQLVSKIATVVERRSIRQLQTRLFQLKRQYRNLHRRYSHLYKFHSYSNRNALSYQASMRQRNTL